MIMIKMNIACLYNFTIVSMNDNYKSDQTILFLFRHFSYHIIWKYSPS